MPKRTKAAMERAVKSKGVTPKKKPPIRAPKPRKTRNV